MGNFLLIAAASLVPASARLHKDLWAVKHATCFKLLSRYDKGRRVRCIVSFFEPNSKFLDPIIDETSSFLEKFRFFEFLLLCLLNLKCTIRLQRGHCSCYFYLHQSHLLKAVKECFNNLHGLVQLVSRSLLIGKLIDLAFVNFLLETGWKIIRVKKLWKLICYRFITLHSVLEWLVYMVVYMLSQITRKFLYLSLHGLKAMLKKFFLLFCVFQMLFYLGFGWESIINLLLEVH